MKERVVKCLGCGVEFRTEHPLKAFCSLECRSKATIPAVCEYCGREFQNPRYHPRRYCTRECLYASLRKQLEKTCPTCGKTFTAAIGRSDIAKYCSPECYWKSKTNRIPRTCVVCGKQFDVRPSELEKGRGDYCSRKCYAASRVAPIELRRCEVCGKMFRPRTLESNRKYCSKACCGKAQQRLVRVVCEHCGKEFEVHRGVTKRVHVRYCSHECRLRRTKRTDIEVAVRHVLDVLNEPYEEQKRIGQYVVDFLLPNRQLCLEADGLYWHSNPKVRRHDKKRDKELRERGYRVIRLTEHAIRMDVANLVPCAIGLF